MSWRVIVVVVVVAGAIMVPAVPEVMVTTDSANYLSIAENVAHGRGCVNSTGRVELVHPFGYSLAMAPFVALGLSGSWAARVVNWLSLVVIGIVAWLLLRELVEDSGWRVLVGALLVTASPASVMFAWVVLTETMCAALVLTFCWLCLRARAGGGRWLVVTSLCGLALWFTRWQGLAVVVGAGLLLRTWRGRGVVILPPLVLHVAGYFAVPAMRPFLVRNGTVCGNVLNVPNGLVAVAAGGVAFALLVRLVGVGRGLPAVRVLVTAVAGYLVALFALVVLNHFDPMLDLRLFVPIAAPVVVLLVGLTLRYLPAVGSCVLAGLGLNLLVLLRAMLLR